MKSYGQKSDGSEEDIEFVPFQVLVFLDYISRYHNKQQQRIEVLTICIRSIIRKEYYKEKHIWDLIINICINERHYMEEQVSRYFSNRQDKEHFMNALSNRMY